MRNPPKKKAGRLRSSTPRRRTKRPARVEPVALPVRYRRLLRSAEAIFSRADEYLGEIRNNLQRGEVSEYSVNVTGLRRVFGAARRLQPFLKNLERHAQTKVAV